MFVPFLVVRGRQQVPCDLLDKKAVVGFIFSEGVNDVVAVSPSSWKRHIGFFTARFSKSCDVEPVAAPTLGISIRLEQCVGEGSDCIRRVFNPVFFERSELVWSGG